MPDLTDVARIVSEFPGAEVAEDGMSFAVPVKGKLKGFAWTWNERVDPKKKKEPNPEVLAIWVRSLTEKDLLIDSDGRVFFTEPHYNGFPAVLTRLPEIGLDELRDILIEAWRLKAPKNLIAELDSQPPAEPRRKTERGNPEPQDVRKPSLDNELTRRMRNLDPDQAKNYRQQTGQ